jgi:hypothetical protein
LFTGKASALVNGINDYVGATCGCTSSVNTFVAQNFYLGLGYGYADVDRKGMCDVNCNNNFLIHMVKGTFVDPILIMLFKKVTHLQRAFVNEGKEGPGVKIILGEMKLFFADNGVILVPPRVSVFLLECNDEIEEWGIQFIE